VSVVDRAPLLWLGSAVACSGLGLAVHTVREFGVPWLFAWETGLAPFIFVQVVIFVLWWHRRSLRPTLDVLLAAAGVVQLIGGAILSILPLPFLPFAPAQTIDHYLTHVILGITQIPLIVIPLNLRRVEELGDRSNGRERTQG
jgi:hypothetical protein